MDSDGEVMDELEEFLASLSPPTIEIQRPSEEGLALPLDEVYRQVPEARTLSEERLQGCMRAIVRAFNHWYGRVMREAAGQYRKIIVSRINPFVRRVEYAGHSPFEAASKLVEEYRARNLVTAGGWAIEEAALAICPTARKASASGVDIERHDPTTNTTYFYALKSGALTTNHDIRVKMGDNFKAIQKLHGQSLGGVRAVYTQAFAAGRPKTTEVGVVRKLSSSEFWAEMTGLDEYAAVRLMGLLFETSGQHVQRDVQGPIDALTFLVGAYLEHPNDPTRIDWDYLLVRTLRDRSEWKGDDNARDEGARFRWAQMAK